jgi:hypothetical protein
MGNAAAPTKLRRKKRAFALIPADSVQNQLDHVTLAMMRRRHVGKQKQLHAIKNDNQTQRAEQMEPGPAVDLPAAKDGSPPQRRTAPVSRRRFVNYL